MPGSDNLVIAILADRHCRRNSDKARLRGIITGADSSETLSLISWSSLTKPLLHHPLISLLLGRDLIILFETYATSNSRHMNGWKTAVMIPATVELRQFRVVAHTVVILDAIFSLDAVITVGMVNLFAGDDGVL